MYTPPPIGPSAPFFPPPDKDRPIEALEDVNTMLEALHNAKSLLQNPHAEHGESEWKNDMDLLDKKSKNLSGQLLALQNSYPQAFHCWNENGENSLSNQISSVINAPREQLSVSYLFSLCDKMQKLHDLLLF